MYIYIQISNESKWNFEEKNIYFVQTQQRISGEKKRKEPNKILQVHP